MPFILYGSMLCPDCVEAKKALAEAKLVCPFVDITESMANMKAFLRIRDDAANASIFDAVRAAGSVGIPCYAFSDGTILLDTAEAVRKATV